MQTREPLYATLLRTTAGGPRGRRNTVATSASREELTNGDGKKLISLQVAPDTKYDSDSDFDYRSRPPRPHFR